MSTTALSAPAPPLRRGERLAVLLAIAAVTALAWLELASMADMEGMAGMAAMDEMDGMSGMDMAMETGALAPWSARDFALMLAMWVVMMVGMMLPSATPMALVYAQVARKARREGSVLPPTGVFVSGYLLAWGAFSVVATLAQWGLERAALLSPQLVAQSPRLGAGLLIAAGVYQLTPWKNACLAHCRNPAHFFARHWRPGTIGALRLGWHHGLYCLGCCAVLMGLLFVGGVMNLLWIAAIALFVLAEKLLPHGVRGGRWAGAGMIALGFVLLLRTGGGA